MFGVLPGMNLASYNTVPCLELDDLLTILKDRDYLLNHLLFPAGKNGLYCGEIETISTSFHKLPQSYVQNYYKLFLIWKGRIKKLVHHETIEVGSQELYITKPGQMKRWLATEDPQGLVIAFSKNFLFGLQEKKNMLVNFPFLSPFYGLHIKPDKDAYHQLNQLIRKIHRECETKSDLSYDLIRVYAMELLLLLKRHTLPDVTNTYNTGMSTISQNFIEALEEHFIRGIAQNYIAPKNVTDFACKINVHPSHMNYALKKTFGKTAKSLIKERLMIAAKNKLIHTDLSVSEIGYFLGFESPSYFIRFFRKLVDQTPVEYRQRNLPRSG